MASLLPSLLRKLRPRSASIRTPRHSEMEKLEDRLLLAGHPAMIQQQQHFAYLLNQARVDPRGAMDAWGLHSDLAEFESRPPLAISKLLHDAATARAEHLAGHGGLAGTLPGRTAWPNATVRDQGYPLPQDWPDAANFVEIVAAGNVIPDARTLLGRLLGDDPTANATHRLQLLGQDAFRESRELGLAVVHTDLPALRDFWTLEVARPETPTSFLTGVVFQDSNNNQQYDPGEGLAGVTVSVGGRQVRTNSAGGWNVAVEPGEHSIFVQGGQFFGTAQARVTVGEENVAVDFISGRSVGVVNFNRWQNGWNPHDVNADGRVNAFDVLLLVAALNETVGGRFDIFSTDAAPSHWHPDVSGDRRLTPFDVLQVVGRIRLGPESVPAPAVAPLAPWLEPADPAEPEGVASEPMGSDLPPVTRGLTNEFLVNTVVPRVQSTAPGAASVAASAAGHSVIAYAGVGPRDRDGVYARRFDDRGEPVGEVFLVNTTITGLQHSPSVAMAADGQFLVVWAGRGPGDQQGVFAQWYNSSGVPVGGETRVNTTTGGVQHQPVVEIADDGSSVVVWTGVGSGDFDGVFLQRYAPDGTPLGGEERVNTTTLHDQSQPAVAMNASGEFLVTWSSRHQDGSDWGVYGQRFRADGSRQGNEYRINDVTEGSQWESSVAMDDAGISLVVWRGYDVQDANWNVYGRWFDEQGQPLTPDLRMNSSPEGIQKEPRAAMTARGASVVTWTSGVPDGSGWEVFGRVYDTSGEPNAEFQVNRVTAGHASGHQHYSAVALSSGATAFMVWSGRGEKDREGVFREEWDLGLETNRPPVLDSIPDWVVDEEVLLTFTVTADDPDLPDDELSFQLEPGAPVGASIHPNTGVFRWTPTEEQGPGVYTLGVRVTDSGDFPLSDVRTFQVTVNEVNRPPVIAPIDDQTTRELESFQLQVVATDPDIPANQLRYDLAMAPPGAAIHADSGLISWIPDESQGPGIYVFTVRVTDDGIPPLSNQTTFHVWVDEVNHPPVLDPIPDWVVDAGEVVEFTVTATDPDLPPNKLTFSLGSEVPAGATLDPDTGDFHWQPQLVHQGQTFAIPVRVIDDGSPELSDEATFHIEVLPCAFLEDFSGWRTDIASGSELGRGSVVVADCHATVTEGDSFLVALETAFTIPDDPRAVQVSFEDLVFDETSQGFVRDAFEIALVDMDGNPLVKTIVPGRDSFFNITEGVGSAVAEGVVVEGNTVMVGLNGLPPGTEATLIIRLVNNDSDMSTTVRITEVGVISSNLAAIAPIWVGSAGALPSLEFPTVPGPTSDFFETIFVDSETNEPLPNEWGDSVVDAFGRVTFATSEQFEEGVLFNLNTTDVPNQLSLNRGADVETFPYIWMANSGEGTVSKVEIHTGKELSRYRTGPNGLADDPSRISLTSEGDIWIANRASGRQASIAKILNTGFVDRNGNGLPDTSSDLNGDGRISGAELFPWDANSDGQPDDERIALWIPVGRNRQNPSQLVPNGVARAVALDANDNVWVGLYNLRQYEVYDGRTGELLGIVPTTGHPYGAVIDGNGYLWTANREAYVERIDTTTLTHLGSIEHGGDNYGITVGPDGIIWTVTYSGNRLVRIDPETESVRTYAAQNGAGRFRGVGVDLEGNVWAASNAPHSMVKFTFAEDGETLLSTQGVPVGNTPTASVVDAEGFIWTTTTGSNQAWRIDPVAMQVMPGYPIPTGPNPYNYSDMTGAIRLRVTERSGTWTETIDAGRLGALWAGVEVDSELPKGTSLSVRVRAADLRADLPLLDWMEVSANEPISPVFGRLLEVEVRLRSRDNEQHPNVDRITVQAVRPPDLTLVQPPFGERRNPGQLLLSGQSRADQPRIGSSRLPNEILFVTVNGIPVERLDVAGNFFTRVDVLPGTNRFEVTAHDRYGQTTTRTLVVDGVVADESVVDFTQFTDITGSFHGAYFRTSFQESTGRLHVDLAVRNDGQFPADVPLLVGVKNVSDPTVRLIGFDGYGPDGVPIYDYTRHIEGSRLLPGERTIAPSITFHNPDRIQFDYELVFYAKVNEAPYITSLPPIEARVGKAYTYDIQAIDPDGDPLTFTLLARASGMTIDQSSGVLTWTPESMQLGQHNITVQASDGRGGVAQQRYVVTVIEVQPNRPPYFTSVPVVDARFNTEYHYPATAQDPDDDPLTFSVLVGPDGLAVGSQDGLVSWLPPSSYPQQSSPPAELASGVAPPTVPSHDVTVYARLPDSPEEFTFAANGDLYSGVGADSSRILKISSRGEQVEFHGNTDIPDPDSVLLDRYGSISGVPGSILVGGLSGSVGQIFAIHPDQSVHLLLGPSSLIGNVHNMLFDGRDRLIFTSWLSDRVMVSTGGQPTTLFQTPSSIQNLAIDQADRIYVKTTDGHIRVYGEDGTLLNNNFATEITGYAPMAFGPGGPWGIDLYLMNRGELLRFDADGQRHVVGTGFPRGFDSQPDWRAGVATNIAFGPDGGLFVGIGYELAGGNGRTGDVLRIAPSRELLGVPPTDHPVTLAVDDGRGGIATQSFVVRVEPELGNRPPVIVSEPITMVTSSHTPFPVTPGFAASVVTTLQEAQNISGLVATSDGKLYFGTVGGDNLPPSIYQFDQSTNTLSPLKTSGLLSPGRITTATSSAFGDDLLHADWNVPFIQGAVYRTNRHTGISTVLSVGTVGRQTGDPIGVALGPGGQFGTDLYVMDFQGASPETPLLTRITPSGQSSIVAQGGLWTTSAHPHDIEFSPGGDFGEFLYVADSDSKKIWRVSPAGDISEFITSDVVVPTAIAFAPGGPFGSDLFALDARGWIVRIRPDGEVNVFATNLPPNEITHGSVPELAFEPSRQRLYVGLHNQIVVVFAGVIDSYTYDVVAIDPDDDALFHSLILGPNGMVIDSQSGEVNWQPTLHDLGSHAVTVRVDDGRGGFDEQSYILEVVPPSASGAIHGTKYNDLDGNGVRSEAIVVSSDWWSNQTASSGVALFPWDQVALPGEHLRLAANFSTGFAEGSVDLPFTAEWTIKLGVQTDGEWDIPDEYVRIYIDNQFVQEVFNTPLDTFYEFEHVVSGDQFQYRFEFSSPSQFTQFDQHLVLVAASVETSGEPGLEGWVMYIDDNANGRLDPGERFTLTDELGSYSFTNLAPGTHRVAEVRQPGWKPTAPATGSRVVTVGAAEVVSGVDFGNQWVGLPPPSTRNQQPAFTSSPPLTINAHERYRYQAQAIDPDGDPLLFDLVLRPEGMVVQATTGVVVWTPTPEQVGVHDVILRVRDDRGGVVLQSFQISVAPQNTPPSITSVPRGPAVVDLAYRYQVTAQDADDDEITFGLDIGPEGMEIDPITGLLSWTPSENQVGEHLTRISADDGRGGIAWQTFQLPVVALAANAPPTISSQPRSTVGINDRYLYQVLATDPDGDPLTYSLDIAPTGMTIDAGGLVAWIPAPGQLGSHEVAVRVEDGRGGGVIQPFTLNVVTRTSNEPPRITSNPPMTATAGVAYQYDAVASDPDGDPLVWRLPAAPPGMSINAQQGTIRWTPSTDQLGSHAVVVEVMDPFGATSTQSYSITVRAVNRPPAITSVPPTTAMAGRSYVYPVRAIDPDDDPLNFSLPSAPQGMTINSQGIIRWTPSAAQTGNQSVDVQVDDGQGGVATQRFRIEVAAETENRFPVITSTAPLAAAVGLLYEYSVTATDPDGDELTFSLLEHPEGMTIDPESGYLTWTPVEDQLGEVDVTVLALDPGGLGGTQTFVIEVSDANNAPTITSSPVQNVTVGLPYRYDVQASDPDNDPLKYSLDTAPTGMRIDQLGRITWAPQVDDVGVHRVEVTVSDSIGASVTQTYDLSVNADLQTPRVDLVISQNPVRVGTSVTFRVTATDNVAVTSIGLEVGGTPVPLDANGRATIVTQQFGGFEVIASASDAAGNTGLATTTLHVTLPIGDPPEAAITTPASGQQVAAPIEVIGTASDENLIEYILEVARTEGGPFFEIGRGNESVVDGVLGRFDPTYLANGSYRLRLTVRDAEGQFASVENIVHVSGDLKVGNFTLSFTDLAIPVSGIPITVTRTYDSLLAHKAGEFGFGWRLEFRETNLRTNVEPTGVEDYGLYNALSDQTEIYITVLGGRRERFTFTPRPMRGFGGIFNPFSGQALYYEPVFTSQPGSTNTLSVPTLSLIRTESQEYVTASGYNYNPADALNFGGKYILTTKEGIRYEIDANSGLMLRVIDRNSNTLTFSDDGITSSTGQQVLFHRDSRGRVTSVTDPAGNHVLYEYDAKGDLIAVTDRDQHVTQFVYSDQRPHFLEEIIDPLGRTGIRSEYDDFGRLVRLLDVNGNPVHLTHNVEVFEERIEDALGNETIFLYDDRGNVLVEVDAQGGQTERTYDSHNNVLSVTDPLGNTTSFTYDNRRNLLTETDSLGNVTRFTYDAFGNVLTTTDSLGNTTTNAYDGRGNLTRMTDAAGNVTLLAYDSAGNQTSITDAAGNVTRFEYDGRGNLTRQEDSAGNITTFTYDANGNQLGQSTVVTTPAGPRTVATTTTYNASGRPTSVTDAEGNVTLTEYDALGNQVASVDALGRKTEYQYDERGQLAGIAFPDGTSTAIGYDELGRRVSSTDRAGHTTRFVYDALGRLIETIHPDGTPDDDTDNPRSRTEYDAAGRVTGQIDELGNRTEFEYDEAGRQNLVRDALGNETVTEYDAAGRVTAVSDALGRTTQFVYDSLGRQTQTIFVDGTSTLTEYDSLGRVVGQTDQAGNVTRFEYDPLGRLAAVVDPLEQRTEYTYDEAGNLTSQTDANGHVTTFEYDLLGRRVATALPLGQRNSVVYNAVGNVVSTTDFNGDTIEFAYDLSNRLTEKRFPDGTATTFAYTPQGQRSTIVDARGVTSYDYDERSRLIARTDPDGTTIEYTYDAAGNRLSVSIPSGTTHYTFDALNRLSTVIDPDGDTTTYSYDAVGTLVLTEFPNGTVELREYDELNRLLFLENSGPEGVISSYRYTLDEVGHRLAVEEHSGRRVEYEYDVLYRLLGEAIFDPELGDRAISYTYDPVGNRLTRDDSSEDVTAYLYDANDRLLEETIDGLATTYTYDENGNTLSRQSVTDSVFYEWDYENRLIAVDTDGDGVADIQYEYDADGIRVASTVGGEETRFLVDGNRRYAQALEEYTPGGIIKVSYVHGLKLISQNRETSGKSFYHADGLGSTRALTDRSGLVTDRYVYDAFGRTIGQVGSTGNVYLFAGEQRDLATGLDYLRARWMSSSVGRFYGMDPFEGLFKNPVTLHRYLYTANSPITFTDPSGRLFLIADLAFANSFRFMLSLVQADVGRQLIEKTANAANVAGSEVFKVFDLINFYNLARFSVGLIPIPGGSSNPLGVGRLLSKTPDYGDEFARVFGKSNNGFRVHRALIRQSGRVESSNLKLFRKDFEHILNRHTVDFFDIAQAGTQNNGWPLDTSPGQILSYLNDALLNNPITVGVNRVQIGDFAAELIVRSSGKIVSFYPTSGPGVIQNILNLLR